MLEKVDKVFQRETVDEVYTTYSSFVFFQRTENMNMMDYILELEHICCKMMHYDMKLPDAVLKFKLLDGAQIADDERKDEICVETIAYSTSI